MNDTFGKWLLNSGRPYLAFTIAIALIAIFTIMITNKWIQSHYAVEVKNDVITKSLELKGEAPRALACICLIHVFAICSILILRKKSKFFNHKGKKFPKENDYPQTEVIKASGYGSPIPWRDAKNVADKVLKQYINIWTCIWMSWFFLYLTLSLQFYFYEDIKNDAFYDAMFQILINLFNNAATVAFVLSYLIFSRPTVSREDSEELDGLPWESWVMTLALLTVAQVFILAVQEKNPAVILPVFSEAFGWISGISAGTAQALYLGRLGSMFLRPPIWLLIFLYMYAAIQALFEDFGNGPWLTAVIINAALFFKCLLFLYVTWLFQSGKLLFYFIRARQLYDKLNKDWENFLKIL